MKVIAHLIILGAGVSVGYGTSNFFRSGFHKLPSDMPEGAFALSFSSGVRGIMTGVPDDRDSRRYLARPRIGVPEQYQGVWSYCALPGEEEAARFTSALRAGPDARLEGICSIDVDGQELRTGMVFSVPKI